MNLKITRTTTPGQKPENESQLGFGKIFTDHLFEMDWSQEKGWHDAQIRPFGEITMSPAATCLHYGQEVFEGLKAYRNKEGNVQLFRPEENLKRLNRSNDRICIPRFDEAFLLHALKELVRIDADWVPKSEGTSLYIRPFVIGTERSLGANASTKYKFLIILSPSGLYYPEGLAPVKINVEQKYVRAVAGGIGAAKTGGNYAASLLAQQEAAKEGYSQVLWLDGVHRKYVEEVGTMNVFFVLGEEVVTPALNGSILPGITRKSAIELLESWGLTVTQREISIDELAEAYKNGTLKEAFGTGTAAIISPIGELRYGDLIMHLHGGTIGPVSQRLYDELTGIQFGTMEDAFHWITEIED